MRDHIVCAPPVGFSHDSHPPPLLGSADAFVALVDSGEGAGFWPMWMSRSTALDDDSTLLGDDGVNAAGSHDMNAGSGGAAPAGLSPSAAGSSIG